MKHAIQTIAFHLSLFALHLSLPAAVPVSWTVDTSRVNTYQIDAYHGETLELEASFFQSDGKPLAITGPAELYYQTNGMGAAWWTATATVASNTISATFTPEIDPGARVLTCFLGGTASTYRAAFRLRFGDSPGATPNLLPLPTVTYDARLNGTPTINGTNLIDYVVAASGAEVDPTVPAWAKQPNPPQSGTDENAVRSIVGQFAATGTVHRASSVGDAEQWTDANGCVWRVETIPARLLVYRTDNGDYQSRRLIETYPADNDTMSSFGGGVWQYTGDSYECEHPSYASPGMDDLPPYTEPPPSFAHYHTYINPDDQSESVYIEAKTATEAVVTNLVGRVAMTNDVPSTPGDIGAAPASVADTVQAWQTYWDGDDVRVTVTNYYGSIDIPHLYIEQRMPADETHDAAWFNIIWDEMTRWNSFLSSYADMTNHVENDLADRAWGVYDSSTGSYSPDGLLQVSQPEIQIAAGLAYQKTITSAGELWVLTATEPMSIGGESTNGYFRITDGEGTPLFEIVKGDKRVVGATAGGIRVIGDEVQIDYMLTDNSSVEIRRTTDLRNGTWETVDATWTGTSGSYTAHVAKPTGPRAFFKASYEVGGETYIKNTAPISAGGGILCTDGIHKCRPVYNNGSITWEVVQ